MGIGRNARFLLASREQRASPAPPGAARPKGAMQWWSETGQHGELV